MTVSVEAETSWRWLVSHLSPPTRGEIAETTCRDHVDKLETLGFPVRKCIGSWYGVKVKHYFKSQVMERVHKIHSQQGSFEGSIMALGEEVAALSRVFALVEDLDESFTRQTSIAQVRAMFLQQGELRASCRQFYETGMRGFEAGCPGQQFDRVNRHLSELQLFEALASDAVLHVLHVRIRDYISEQFAGQSLERSIIARVLAWVERAVLPFIQLVCQHLPSALDLSTWQQRIHFLCYKTIASTRIADLFEIMVDYPESHGAVTDIKTCLAEVHCRSELVTSARSTLVGRLLHPGANTEDIITQYSSAIKVLRFIDPSGVILEQVCLPLRRYLKAREDTIRCILGALLSSQELGRELGKTTLFQAHNDSDLETEGWESWTPPTRDMPAEATTTSKSGEIVSTLCSIYGSADLFIKEYRNLVADKLLTTSDYDIAYEMRGLELLKIAFGEDLAQCQIMLQDVVDSRRTHSNITAQMTEGAPFDVNVLIISHVFWPNLRKEEMAVYKPLQQYLEGGYQRLFSELKRSRALEWRYNLGFVDLDLEFEGRSISFTVSPLQATIIALFEERERCHAETISAEVGIPLVLTRKKLSFWVTNGVLKETSKDMFEVREDAGTTRSRVVEEMDSAMVKIEQIRQEELESYTNFVMGLINQSGQITVERVHKLLSMLLEDSVAGMLTEEEVKAFLDKKVKQKLLSYSSGVYKKHKA